MSEIFLSVVNMSISASWIVLAVLVLRFVLKKAPKWITVLLWGIVAIRLVCPFSIESAISLMPSAQTIMKTPDAPRPHFESGVTIVDNQVNEYLQGHYFEGVTRPTGHFVDIMTILAIVWIVGVVVLLAYTIISYLRVKNKAGTAVLLRDNIFQSENVVSPFVFGVVKPKIYLPFHISEQDMQYVIAHENAHVSRKDHWWKPLGFLLLAIHWFNPLIWLGYMLLCRDIELACDEKVVKEMNAEQKADYSQALLTCSVNRRIIAACPLAFGEVNVKDRVKSVLHYKKPAFWIVVAAVVLSVVVAVCFLTNPPAKAKPENIKELPRYEELTALIGLSPEEVEQKVQWDLTETELEYDDMYQTPIEVEICDVDLYIMLAENSMVGKIDSVLYCADYTNDNEKAAEDILKIAKHLGSTIGKNTQLQQWDLFEMTQEEVLEELNDERLREIEWDLTPVATQSQKEYMELSSSVWESVNEGSRLVLVYALEMKVTRVEDTIYLRLGLGPRRRRENYTVVNEQ